LTFQCRNFIKAKVEEEDVSSTSSDSDEDSAPANNLPHGKYKLQKAMKRRKTGP